MRPGIEPRPSRLSVLRAELLRHWWGSCLEIGLCMWLSMCLFLRAGFFTLVNWQPVCKIKHTDCQEGLLRVSQIKGLHTVNHRIYLRPFEIHDPPKYWPKSVLPEFQSSNGNRAYWLIHYGKIENSYGKPKMSISKSALAIFFKLYTTSSRCVLECINCLLQKNW